MHILNVKMLMCFLLNGPNVFINNSSPVGGLGEYCFELRESAQVTLILDSPSVYLPPKGPIQISIRDSFTLKIYRGHFPFKPELSLERLKEKTLLGNGN